VLEQLTSSRYQSSHPGKKTTKGAKNYRDKGKRRGRGEDIWEEDEGVRERGRRRRRGVSQVGVQIG